MEVDMTPEWIIGEVIKTYEFEISSEVIPELGWHVVWLINHCQRFTADNSNHSSLILTCSGWDAVMTDFQTIGLYDYGLLGLFVTVRASTIVNEKE